MKLSFRFSKEKEQKRLLNIHSEYQWFLDNDFPIFLPEFYNNLFKQSKSKKDFLVGLKEKLDKVYNEEEYSEKTKIAEKNWLKVEKEFFKILSKFKFNIKDNYICQISLYGPEGQFKYPNTINLRLSNNKDVEMANETIAHELIHLVILPKAEKMGLDYKQIEGVVDLFFKETDLKNLFPKYKLQSIGDHDNKIFQKIIH